MSGQHSRQAPHLTCAECQQWLQEYRDGGLAKPDSMRVFLHIRACEQCTAELARLERLVTLLETLPEREPPADFDAKVLAAVPYESYRAMAGLRQPRVPVFLEQETLPAWLRARGTRLAGMVIAATLVAGRFADLVPDPALAGAVLGLVPEVTVQLQRIGRRLALALATGREGV